MIISGKCFVVICPFSFTEENPPNPRRIAKLKETGTQAFCRERNLKNHEERTLRPPTPPKPVLTLKLQKTTRTLDIPAMLTEWEDEIPQDVAHLDIRSR